MLFGTGQYSARRSPWLYPASGTPTGSVPSTSATPASKVGAPAACRAKHAQHSTATNIEAPLPVILLICCLLFAACCLDRATRHKNKNKNKNKNNNSVGKGNGMEASLSPIADKWSRFQPFFCNWLAAKQQQQQENTTTNKARKQAEAVATSWMREDGTVATPARLCLL